ncbi:MULTISPECIES: CaiB/BaiF CoA-transferase family protein [Streptomyces]|uniref:CaiB/BaiF CoA transferase family protein n=1 Tax=Streptomyces TaxID=1883 RepID=UPI0018A83AAE|nr:MULTISPECIES: CoA transferase [Streptomyces]MBF8173988.1 CoA transferase [Streptomyces olivaceus]MBZ6140781.1 CoA transferase [Streptomyces olivaceus]MBZ6168543.1 CoA transferase [Streptomyces olivaceus]MCM8552822.1 CoA transferase [Streptomyces sp. STCH 565 A]
MTTPLLEGVRILDLTNVLAGPFAGYQLALQGADVIKVEVPESGDLARQLGADRALGEELLGASFLAQNGGKRSLTLNLKAPEGREALLRAVRETDVLLENFRPGVMDRLGVGWKTLRAENPHLVYCAISGFGQTGPLRDRPAYDQIIQGLSGMMSVTGTPGTAPLRAGFPVADTLGGMAAAYAVAAALVRRGRTGEGAFVDVSMLESALTAMGWVTSNYLISGRDPRPMGNENFTAAPSGTFRTADGHLNIAANRQQQYTTLCRLVGREDLATDPRFTHPADRKTHRDALREEVESALAARSAAEWEEILSDAGVPAARVLSVPDALALDHLAARGFVHDLPFPDGRDRPLHVLGSPVRVDDGPAAAPVPPPLLGEHTDEILAELGYTPAEITALREGGAV